MTEYKKTFKALFFFALPIILSTMISSASSFISMLLMAQINSDALAAGALITSTYGLFIMMVISFLYSVSILIGQSKGRGCDSDIGHIISSGIVLVFMMSIPLSYIFLNLTPILQLLHQPPNVSLLVGEYFHGLAYGLIPSLMGAVFTQFFLGIGKARISLFVAMIGILVNSAVSYILIFGYGSIKPLGVFGAGLASSITAFVLLALVSIYICFSAQFKPYQIKLNTLFSLKYCKLLTQMGIPISMQYTLELLAFSAITYLMGIIGTESLAAQQIILQCSMFSIMVIMGLSQAGSILVSHNMGKNAPLDRMIICKTTLLFGALIMFVVGLCYWQFSEQIISFYVDTQNPSLDSIVLTAKTFLIIAAFTQFFDAGRNIAAGLLRGYGDTKTSMWTGLVSCWVIGIPLSIVIAFPCGFGGPGLRFGILVGIFYGCMRLIKQLSRIKERNYFVTQYKAIGDLS